MNIRDYKVSGIVESYVLGLATELEREEFEQMCAAYPELVTLREEFEASLEMAALASAVPPPSGVREKILNNLTDQPTAPAVAEKTAPAPKEDHKPVTPAFRELNAGYKKIGWLRLSVAASLILLAGSVILNIYLSAQNKDYRQQNQALLASQSDLVKQKDNLQTRLGNFEESFALIANRDMKLIPMLGANVPTSPDPSSVVTLFWNKKSQEVFLKVNSLPKPDVSKQYQLWAIVNGQPVSAGVFDQQNEAGIQKMLTVANAQAFAVTLEQQGGSESPTLETMIVLGNS